MIDTSKYEEHTRGPWRYYGHEEFDGWWILEGEDIEAQARVEFAVFEVVRGLDDPDLNLMMAAPDLLAEVERLREKQIRYKNIVGEFDEFMCNNWTPDNVHSLWNELFSKYPATRGEEE